LSRGAPRTDVVDGVREEVREEVVEEVVNGVVEEVVSKERIADVCAQGDVLHVPERGVNSTRRWSRSTSTRLAAGRAAPLFDRTDDRAVPTTRAARAHGART